MPLQSETDARGFVRLRIEGAWPTNPELLAWYETIDARAMRRLLIDIRAASGPLPKFPDIRETIAAFDADTSTTRARRRAVIVSSDVQFGIARSFQALVDGEMEVFRDEAAAIAWLLDG